jgi:hypothetical protein
MPNEDWRFKGFQSQLGVNDGNRGVTAASRIIPSPSGTDWNQTFRLNNPSAMNLSSPYQETSRSLLLKAGQPTRNSALKAIGYPGSRDDVFFKENAAPSEFPFQFHLSPANDSSQLSIGTDQSDFYKDRVSNMDLTKRDHELYGAGSNYGFAY